MRKWEELKKDVTKSQVWRAIFRHGYEDTPRNRVLMVTANVWLHLHPAKVRGTVISENRYRTGSDT